MCKKSQFEFLKIFAIFHRIFRNRDHFILYNFNSLIFLSLIVSKFLLKIKNFNFLKLYSSLSNTILADPINTAFFPSFEYTTLTSFEISGKKFFSAFSIIFFLK